MERLLGPFFAVFVSLLGGALVVVTTVGYALYGYCEDYCDGPKRSNTEAFTTMLPFGIAAVAVMTGAVYLFMAGESRTSWWRALAVAATSCLVFGGAFWALVWLDNGLLDGTAAWLVGVPAVIVWEALTAVAARRLARRRSAVPRTG
jgi:FtsH-binding integral membrane protein